MSVESLKSATNSLDVLHESKEVLEDLTKKSIDPVVKPLVYEGRENLIKTAKGDELKTNLAITEASAVIASHDALGNQNPDYPQELQPRDRSRQSSQQQIHKIASDLDPDSLGRSNRADFGAPIVGTDMVVESGNGRTIGIKLAYQQGKANEYRNWLIENAEYFGFDPDKVANMSQPVLIRIRKTEVNRSQFAVDANQDDKLSYSATERARSDAKRITGGLLELFNPDDSGNLLAASNAKFIQGFLNSLGESEAAQYSTTDGKPTQALVTRIKAALFSKAYNDDRLLEMVADQTKPDLQNVLNALSIAAPKFIETQAISQTVKGQLEDISSNIVTSIDQSLDKKIVSAILEATNVIQQAKISDQAITEYVSQLGLFGDLPEGVAELAVFIANNTRSAKKLSIAFKAMAEFAENQEIDSQNFGLFGDPEPVSIKDAVNYANEKLSIAYGNEKDQISFFDSALNQDEIPIDALAHEAATSPNNEHAEPTDKNKISGNYLKGKINFNGMIVAIENPAGSIRSGTDKNGEQWQNEMHHHYGFIEGTKGADGDELDVFIKQGITQLTSRVYVINQINPSTKKFDEHKIVLGADSAIEAKEIYLSAYDKNWQGFGSMVDIDLDKFKTLISKTWIMPIKSLNQFDDASVESLNSSGFNEAKITSYSQSSENFMNEALQELKTVDAIAHPVKALALAIQALSYRGTAPAFEQENPIVEHITKKGNALKGIVIPFDKLKTKKAAKNIDEYTFSRDGGWFIRLKHLPNIQDSLLSPAQLHLKERLNNAKYSDGNTNETGESGTGLNDGGRVENGRFSPEQLAGYNGAGDGSSEYIGNGSTGVSISDASGIGSGSDLPANRKRKHSLTDTDFTAIDGGGSAGGGESGLSTKRKRDKNLVRNAQENRKRLTEKEQLQLDAEGVATDWGNVDSIQAALPYLLPEQQDDTLKIEQHLIDGNNNGILCTNGTGTGKTFTGLGSVKRFANAGLKNILIVTMNDKIARDFVKSGKPLNINIHQLEGIKDNGGQEHSIVVTTFANLSQNNTLAEKDWNLIVIDEAQNLMQSQKGTVTRSLTKLRALSGHHAGFNEWFNDRFKHEEPERKLISMPVLDADGEEVKNSDGTTKTEMVAAGAYLEGEATDKWYKKHSEERDLWQKRWNNQPKGRTKVIFLSATPWGYVKNIEWAEGYLFHFTDPAAKWKSDSNGTAYNEGNDREKFFMTNFGFTMRTNRLTQPDGKVDSGVNERAFAEKIKESGAMFGRELVVPFDYERRFVLIESAAGKEIDRGLEILWSTKDKNDRNVYSELVREVLSGFGAQERASMLESIKADAIIDQIKKHIALGRKVIVFHDYIEGGSRNPFNFDGKTFRNHDMQVQYERFKSEHPELVNLAINFGSPIETLKKAFPNALLFNGTIDKKVRAKDADRFNDDEGGRNLIIVQSAAGATGISYHDTTGKFQRAIYNIGLPKQPSKLRQTEGRIYRVGQASNAIMRYVTTGTKWEASAFAQTIAQRAETVDNLARGDDAVVSIRDAIISAYEAAEYFDPSEKDGIGGKAYDEEHARIAKLSSFDKAMTLYYNKGKNRDSRANKAGKDWYATPEPLGLKMVQWAGVHAGDDVLEPSSGDGAIARWIPANANGVMVEPSMDLASKAQMANPSAKIEIGSFEDHNTMIKYDAVVMNPPFGHAGNLAFKHVQKACKHLTEGGRIVALVPRSPNFDQLLETWLDSVDAKDFHLTSSISLPSSTFQNANTSVNTRIVILERHAKVEDAPDFTQLDYSNLDSVEDLFEKIKDVSITPRKLRRDEALLEYGLILSPYRNSNILTGLGVKTPEIRKVLEENRYVYTVSNDPDALECYARNIDKVLTALNESGVAKLMPHTYDGYDSWQHDGIYEHISINKIKVDMKRYVVLEHAPKMKTPLVVAEQKDGKYLLLSGYERYKLAKNKSEHFVPAIIFNEQYLITRETLAKAYRKSAKPLVAEIFAKNLLDVLDDEAMALLPS